MNKKELLFLEDLQKNKESSEVILNLGQRHSFIFSDPQFGRFMCGHLFDGMKQFLEKQISFRDYE